MSTPDPQIQGQQGQLVDTQIQSIIHTTQIQQPPQTIQVQKEAHSTHNSNAGEVLQAATTISSLIVAVVILLPAGQLKSFKVLTIGNAIDLPLNYALLFCGLLSFLASFWTLDHLRRESGVPLGDFFRCRTYLTVVFAALLVFTLIFISICISSY